MVRLRLIGDVVFTTPALGALRRKFPHARITYLVESPAEPVVRNHPGIDEVVVVDRPRGLARVGYDLALARRLKAARFDLAIDFHGGPRSGFLTWATRAPQRIGYGLPGRGWCYTTRVDWTRSLVPPRHSVLNQWALLEPLGIEPPDRARDAVTMPLDPDAVRRIDERLASSGIDRDARLIVLHVSAGNPFRRWPAASFAAAAATLAAEDASRRLIITSGPSESAAAEMVADEARRLAGPAASRIVRTGEFDLAELRALVDRAVLYIGGDSGPLHIAATTRTPIVALFGPTLPGRSMPWRDPSIGAIAVDAGELPCRPCHQRACVPGDFRCLTAISPTMVVTAATALLQTAEGKRLKAEGKRQKAEG
ncbi:MAG TPA: glycosyltransferase family 9 protein [Vicinamibacterales bacterium]|nr:glycosyltransferase family 9 protein [Vicinamibacterales bacterium]